MHYNHWHVHFGYCSLIASLFRHSTKELVVMKYTLSIKLISFYRSGLGHAASQRRKGHGMWKGNQSNCSEPGMPRVMMPVVTGIAQFAMMHWRAWIHRGRPIPASTLEVTRLPLTVPEIADSPNHRRRVLDRPRLAG